MLGDRFGSHQRDSQDQTKNSRRGEYAPGVAPDDGTGYYAIPASADQPSADDAGDHTDWTNRTTPPSGDRPAGDFIDLSFVAHTIPGGAEDSAPDRASDDTSHTMPSPESTSSLSFTREPGTGVFGPPPGVATETSHDTGRAGTGTASDPDTMAFDLPGRKRPRGEAAGREVAGGGIAAPGVSERDVLDGGGSPLERPTRDVAAVFDQPWHTSPGDVAGIDGVVSEGTRSEGVSPAGGADDDHDIPRVRLGRPGDATDGNAPAVGAVTGGRFRGKAAKVGAVAAALAVLAGTAVTVTLTSGGSEPEEAQVLTARRQADPAQAAQRQKAVQDQRRRVAEDAAARAGRNAFRDRPGLRVKSKPKPQPAGAQDPGPIGPVLAGSPREIAREMLPKYGWSPDSQFGCLDRLWQKESGWNPRAANPSGAYGIPQALPGSKMASAGADWESNPATQIEWGLDYIKGRYASPCGAWSHSENVGWY